MSSGKSQIKNTKPTIINKMKSLLNRPLLGAILLTALTATGLRAQSPAQPDLPLVITITATGIAQGDSTDHDNNKIDTTKTKSTKVKISTSEIIKLIGESLSVSFSKQAKLEYQDGSVSVVDGSDVTDASSYLEIDLDPHGQGGVWSGTDAIDDVSGDESQKLSGSYSVSISFDDGNGNSFEFNGVASENVSIAIPDKNGNQKGSDSISMKVSGDGQADGSNVVGSATIKATASGTLD
jgi:hypothetical protein